MEWVVFGTCRTEAKRVSGRASGLALQDAREIYRSDLGAAGMSIYAFNVLPSWVHGPKRRLLPRRALARAASPFWRLRSSLTKTAIADRDHEQKLG